MTSTEEGVAAKEAAGSTMHSIMYKDVVMPACYLQFSKEIEEFAVRPDDVWVVSHPKAGTTWTQEMVWLIGNESNFEGAKEKLALRFPYLENCMMLSNTPNVERVPSHVRESVRHVAAMTSPRFVKTHLPWQLLPQQLQDVNSKAKVIYVARNAKDTCVSFYYHFVLMNGFKDSFQEFCKQFLADQMYYAPFWPHILDFWKRRDQPNILFITYEDMINDLPSVIRHTAHFLGKSLSPNQVSALSTHLCFTSMKRNAAVNHEDVVAKTRTGDGEFIRKGQVGGWREEMSKELAGEFDVWIQENLRNTGLELREF